MSDQPFLRELLDDIKERIDETCVEVKEFRAEAASTYAREVDCAARSERERNDRSEGVKRLWDTVEDHAKRLTSLETAGATEAGADSVKSEAWKWLLGILAGLITALILMYLARVA